MTIDQKKARISDALVAHKGLDHIIDVAADVMGNPMFILDTSMKAISRSKPAPELAELWETLEDSNNDRLLISRTVEQAGIYDHLMHNDTPIYGEFSFCPCRMLGCRIRDKVQAIAYICMFEVNPITPEDEELLVYLCKVIYHEMLYTGETAMQRNPVFSVVCDLLEGNIGYQEYLNRSSYANLRIPKKLRLLVLDYDKNQIGLSIYYIHRVLSEGLNHIFSVIYHEQILLAMDERLWNQTVADSILEHLQNYNIRLAVSYPLDDIMMLPNAYVQANSALRIGRSLNPERKFYAYEDYALQDFLQAAANHISLGVHIHPWVKLLESYDAANDTELSQTLSCYLEQHKRAGKTAQKLFIHRSTLYARLEKITDLLDIPALDDIEDDLFLRLSFCISRYC